MSNINIQNHLKSLSKYGDTRIWFDERHTIYVEPHWITSLVHHTKDSKEEYGTSNRSLEKALEELLAALEARG